MTFIHIPPPEKIISDIRKAERQKIVAEILSIKKTLFGLGQRRLLTKPSIFKQSVDQNTLLYLAIRFNVNAKPGDPELDITTYIVIESDHCEIYISQSK